MKVPINADSISVQKDIDLVQEPPPPKEKAIFTDGKLKLSSATIDEIKSYVNN